MVAAAEQTARETMGEELPQPEPVPDEAPAERFPIRALLRPPMVGRLALFVGIWFVYYIGNYGWLTLAPTLFVDKGYSLAASTTYLIVSGIGFPVGPSRHHAFQRPLRAQALRRHVRRGLGDLAADHRLLRIARDHHHLRLHRVDDHRTARPDALHLHGRAVLDQRPGYGRGSHRWARARLGGALAPLIILGAYAAWGFSGAFVVMAIWGFVRA